MTREPEQMVFDPVAGEVHGEWGFKDVSTNELTHGIHPYPARLVPQVARKIIETYPTRKGYVWDPFCGSGTVLLEAMTHEHESVGTDLNPLACLIARAKTTVVPPDDVERWGELVIKRLRSTRAEKARLVHTPKLDAFTLDPAFWWKPSVIRDLSFIKGELQELATLGADEAVMDLFDVAFSRTVRQTSNQRPNEFKRYRRPQEEVDKLRFDPVSVFLTRWSEVVKAAGELARKYPEAPRPSVLSADSSTFTPERNVGLLVTSPPYGDSTTTVAYGQYSSLMMEWIAERMKADWRRIDRDALGGNLEKSREKPKSETLNQCLAAIEKVDPARAKVVEAFFGDMRACLKNFRGAMAVDGHACFVIGDRTVREVKVPNSVILTEEAEDVGFEHVETMARRIYFKVGPYRVNPIGRTGRDQDTPAIGKEQIVVLAAS